MTCAELFIDGMMPGLNDWRDAIHKSPHAGNAMTREQVRRVETAARVQMLPHFEGRVDLFFLWTEPNMRRDPDNIEGAGVKFILDGLVRAGVLDDDGPRYVGRISHDVAYDPLNVGVAVFMTDERLTKGDPDGA